MFRRPPVCLARIRHFTCSPLWKSEPHQVFFSCSRFLPLFPNVHSEPSAQPSVPFLHERFNMSDPKVSNPASRILKTECIYRHKLTSFRLARSFIDSCITFYNTERIQSKNRSVSALASSLRLIFSPTYWPFCAVRIFGGSSPTRCFYFAHLFVLKKTLAFTVVFFHFLLGHHAAARRPHQMRRLRFSAK